MHAHEQVPSWQVTSTQLEAWGFPVERFETIVGCTHKVNRGQRFHEALHAAWAAGFVRIESMPEAERERSLAEWHEGHARARRTATETIAQLEAAGLIRRRPTHEPAL